MEFHVVLINAIAVFVFVHSGDLIPKIDYTAEEVGTWTAVFNNVLDLMPKHFCMEYRDAFKMLQDDGIFTADKIPQLCEMSDFLKKHTGFTLRPAAGLLTARDFLASLAFRVFQSTQYIRHRTSPFHTPEPYVIFFFIIFPVKMSSRPIEIHRERAAIRRRGIVPRPRSAYANISASRHVGRVIIMSQSLQTVGRYVFVRSVRL